MLVSTNKIHTNILKGGSTDANLKYFNIKNYFKQRKINKYFAIDEDSLLNSLKKDVLKTVYKDVVEECNGTINNKEILF